MPNKAAAIKALRQTKRRTVLNSSVAKELKLTLKRARRATEVKSAESQKLLKETVRLIDKSVRKKVLKKNAAARTKSRLMKLWQKRSGSGT
jgi:small subunit ribosomal protein S20